MEQYGNVFLKDLMQVLILTGSFACAMAFHNVTMRYFYAMGREGILPRSLGKTHPKHKSPYVASITQTVIALALVLAWGIGSGFSFADASDTAYVRIYTMMAVQGVAEAGYRLVRAEHTIDHRFAEILARMGLR